MSKDLMGDRLKAYELKETSRTFFKTLPVYARIDGRGFSKLTKGLERPYDIDFSKIMIETTRKLVEKTNAKIGYTQSDEISLVWMVDSSSPEAELLFAGKIQKLCSVLASLTTSIFMLELYKNEKLHKLIDMTPHFDCRVFQLPSETEAANTFLWRERDAVKNSVSMAARSIFSHKSLQDKSSTEMKEMMMDKGLNFEYYPMFFKHGTFLQRKVAKAYIDDTTWEKIPKSKRPETRECIRSSVEQLSMPSFSLVTNREGVIFRGETPFIKINK